MVRFIIFTKINYNDYIRKIYIPIWLDLLSETVPGRAAIRTEFTFQYG